LGLVRAKDRQILIATLSKMGHFMVGEGKNCSQFLRVIRKTQPELAIMDVSLSGDAWETASVIEHEGLSALLLVSASPRTYSIAETQRQMFTVFSLPIEPSILMMVVELIWSEFRKRHQLLQEFKDLKVKQQSRMVIERAKGMLMNQYSLEEEKAYRMLQKMSMNERIPLAKVAEKVIDGNTKNML